MKLRNPGRSGTSRGPAVRHRSVPVLPVLIVLILCGASPALSATAVPAPPDDPSTSIVRKKLLWVVSDLARLIEEIRRADDPASRKLLAEDAEALLERDVTFQLRYKGTRTAAGPGGDEPPPAVSADGNLNDLTAMAYALTGLARAYEGYPAAAEKYLKQARTLDPAVLDRRVRIDSFEPEQTVGQWLDEARNLARGPNAVVLRFFVRKLDTATVQAVREAGVRFDTGVPSKDPALEVAARDFMTGLARSAVSALTRPKAHRHGFSVYLPVGTYTVTSGTGGEFKSRIRVDADPGKNLFVLEGMTGGLVVYPVPSLETLDARLQAPAPVKPGNEDKGGHHAPK